MHKSKISQILGLATALLFAVPPASAAGRCSGQLDAIMGDEPFASRLLAEVEAMINDHWAGRRH